MGLTDDATNRSMVSQDILAMISHSIEEAEQKIGRFNILIAGRTGVGKSTLINEVFQGRLAKLPDKGRPVTDRDARVHQEGCSAGDI